MIEVVSAGGQAGERYSAYVACHPRARFGHDLEWAWTLRDTYGAEIEHLMAVEEGQVVGICPLFLCKPLIGGAHLQTSLFPSFFGPLYDSERALDKILEAVVSRTSALENAEILSPFALPEDTRLPFVENLDLTFKVSLDHTPEQVYGAFRRNYKRILRDPDFLREVELVVDSEGILVKEFHRLYTRLYARRHGFIPHVEALFRNIFANYRDGMARIYMARHRGKYIGGIFTFWKYGEVYCGWSAQDVNAGFHPMHFLIWKIMQDGIVEGFHWFNHGEAPRHNENLKLFKQGWGMEASDTYRYFIPGKLRQPNVRLYDRFPWVNKIVAALPVQVTVSLLSPLIRYLL